MTKTHTANTPAARSAASQRTLSMTYTALFVVVMAVCSWITIPMTVPFTLQTFGVYMTLLLLGGRRGTLAIGIYLLLGAVGAPVFAGFAGGPGSLMGPTGGYLIGFLVMGLCYWLLISLLARDREEPALWQHLAALLAGVVLLYVFGTVWFVHVYTAGGEAVTYGTAMAWCVFPFLVPEAGKLLLAFSLAPRLRRHMK